MVSIAAVMKDPSKRCVSAQKSAQKSNCKAIGATLPEDIWRYLPSKAAAAGNDRRGNRLWAAQIRLRAWRTRQGRAVEQTATLSIANMTWICSMLNVICTFAQGRFRGNG
jgi:hypothetical protein